MGMRDGGGRGAWPTRYKILAAVVDILAGHGRILLGTEGYKLLVKKI